MLNYSLLYQQVFQFNCRDGENRDLKPDDRFLKLFAGVVDNRWLSLTSILSLTSMIEEVKNKEDKLSHQDCALLILNKWASQDDATYGQLCQRLKTIALFQPPHQ